MTRSLPVGTESPGRARIGARTLRRDNWWRSPLIQFVLLCAWIAYATVRVLSQDNFFVAKYHYLSPFTSPCVTAS